MLFLSRKCGESIVIGSGIIVTVMHVYGKTVSLGIDAPREIGIRRGELSERARELESPSVKAMQIALGLR
jgi:carbon storage regulator